MSKNLLTKGTYVEYYPNIESKIVCAVVKSNSTGEVLSRGISRCNENDIFNLEFGKKLARLYAYEKLGNKIIKEYKKYRDNLYGLIDSIDENMSTINAEIGMCGDKIYDLMDGLND
jgi:hypothetical protein